MIFDFSAIRQIQFFSGADQKSEFPSDSCKVDTKLCFIALKKSAPMKILC